MVDAFGILSSPFWSCTLHIVDPMLFAEWSVFTMQTIEEYTELVVGKS